MTTHVVSFIGSPNRNYELAKYQFDGTLTESEYVAEAVVASTTATAVTIFGTKESLTWHKDKLRSALERHGAEPRFEEIDAGQSPPAQWRLFERLLNVLGAHSGPVIVDITHGYRSIPFLAGAVLTFDQLVHDRARSPRIVYGARDDMAPAGEYSIWDVSLFGEISLWAADIMTFRETGRARRIAQRLEADARKIRSEQRQSTSRSRDLSRLSKTLEAFSSALSTVRIGELVAGSGKAPSLARQLHASLEAAERVLEEDYPPLARVIQHVLDDLQKLSCDEDPVPLPLGQERGQQVLVQLARHYLALERYPEALVVVREGSASRGMPAAATIPKHGFDDDLRSRLELPWKKENRRSTLVNLRNDVEHGGFRSNPFDADTVKLRTKDEVERFAASGADSIVAPMLPQALHFANVSNHPLETWSDEQREAARALVDGGDLIDVPFPQVDPDRESVTEVVDALAEAVPANTKVAMVMGELGVTMELVQLLQQRGVRCVVATSSRVVEDGEAGKLVRFTFRRFRDYPGLA